MTTTTEQPPRCVRCGATENLTHTLTLRESESRRICNSGRECFRRVREQRDRLAAALRACRQELIEANLGLDSVHEAIEQADAALEGVPQ